MENKYYTPEIEEFHVGFEYEILNTDSNTEDVWKKTTPDPYLPNPWLGMSQGMGRIRELFGPAGALF